MTEREFQRWLLQYAKFRGWKSAHFDASVRVVGKPGATRHVGDVGAAGFPDLVLVREERLVFAELKRDGAYASVNQREWLEILTACSRAGSDGSRFEVYLWRPADMNDIEACLW